MCPTRAIIMSSRASGGVLGSRRVAVPPPAVVATVACMMAKLECALPGVVDACSNNVVISFVLHMCSKLEAAPVDGVATTAAIAELQCAPPAIAAEPECAPSAVVAEPELAPGKHCVGAAAG